MAEEGKLLEVVAEDPGVVGVEPGKRLVEDDQPRGPHELLGEGGAAGLAAAERRDTVVEPRAQPEKFRELFEPPLGLFAEILLVHRDAAPVHERLADGQVLAELRFLRQYGDPLPDFLPAVIQPADTHFRAFLGAVQAFEQAKQRGLALSGLPDDGEDFAGGQIEVDVLEQGLLAGAYFEILHVHVVADGSLLRIKYPVPVRYVAPGEAHVFAVLERDALEPLAVLVGDGMGKLKLAASVDGAHLGLLEAVLAFAERYRLPFRRKRHLYGNVVQLQHDERKTSVFHDGAELVRPNVDDVAVVDFGLVNRGVVQFGDAVLREVLEEPLAFAEFDDRMLARDEHILDAQGIFLLAPDGKRDFRIRVCNLERFGHWRPVLFQGLQSAFESFASLL